MTSQVKPPNPNDLSYYAPPGLRERAKSISLTQEARSGLQEVRSEPASSSFSLLRCNCRRPDRRCAALRPPIVAGFATVRRRYNFRGHGRNIIRSASIEPTRERIEAGACGISRSPCGAGQPAFTSRRAVASAVFAMA
jgi:hypothetical protein